MQQLCDHFPTLQRWVHWVYSQQPWLFFGDQVLCSAKGVQQGDPLGPFLFALPLHPTIQRIHSVLVESLPPLSFLNLWYLDDGTLVLPLELVPTNLQKATILTVISLMKAKVHAAMSYRQMGEARAAVALTIVAVH